MAIWREVRARLSGQRWRVGGFALACALNAGCHTPARTLAACLAEAARAPSAEGVQLARELCEDDHDDTQAAAQGLSRAAPEYLGAFYVAPKAARACVRLIVPSGRDLPMVIEPSNLRDAGCGDSAVLERLPDGRVTLTCDRDAEPARVWTVKPEAPGLSLTPLKNANESLRLYRTRAECELALAPGVQPLPPPARAAPPDDLYRLLFGPDATAEPSAPSEDPSDP